MLFPGGAGEQSNDESEQLLFAAAVSPDDDAQRVGELVEMLMEAGVYLDETFMDALAFCGRAELLVAADVAKGGALPLSSDALDDAAAGGFREVVEYLVESRGEVGTCRALDEAATYGHLPVVVYLVAQGLAGSPDAINGAAANGHTHVVRCAACDL